MKLFALSVLVVACGDPPPAALPNADVAASSDAVTTDSADAAGSADTGGSADTAGSDTASVGTDAPRTADGTPDPDAGDDAGPDAAADAAPDAVPDSEPDAEDDAADGSETAVEPDVAGDAGAEVAEDAAADTAGDSADDAAADATADAADDAAPDGEADAVPEAGPDTEADVGPDAAPDAGPDAEADAAAVDTDIAPPPECVTATDCSGKGPTGACMAWACVADACALVPAPAGSACSDGDACTLADSCANGVCVSGVAAVCDDANGCTDDSCDKDKGCVALANAATCSDGNACTADTCDKGCVFLPVAVTCDDGDACSPLDTCKDAACVAGAPLPCVDGDPCTTDGCKAGSCAFVALPDCVTCYAADFPADPNASGTGASSDAAFVEWALTPAAGATPYAVTAEWQGAGDATGAATATWSLPPLVLGKGTVVRFTLLATLGDGTCGADDLVVRLDGQPIHTVCSASGSSQMVEVTLPGPALPAKATLDFTVVAGKATGQSGTVVLDNIEVIGQCLAPASACGTCKAGFGCDKGSGQCDWHIVLSEIATQGPDGASDEFVELYNPADEAIAVGGLLLQYRSATGTSWSNKATANGLPTNAVPAHGYLLVAGPGYGGTVVPDVLLTTDIALAATAGVVQLLPQGTSSAPLDLVAWGTTSAFEGAGSGPTPGASPASVERKASGTSTALTMAPGGAEASKGNGWDSNYNAADWIVRSLRDPHNAKP